MWRLRNPVWRQQPSRVVGSISVRRTRMCFLSSSSLCTASARRWQRKSLQPCQWLFNFVHDDRCALQPPEFSTPMLVAFPRWTYRTTWRRFSLWPLRAIIVTHRKIRSWRRGRERGEESKRKAMRRKNMGRRESDRKNWKKKRRK